MLVVRNCICTFFFLSHIYMLPKPVSSFQSILPQTLKLPNLIQSSTKTFNMSHSRLSKHCHVRVQTQQNRAFQTSRSLRPSHNQRRDISPHQLLAHQQSSIPSTMTKQLVVSAVTNHAPLPHAPSSSHQLLAPQKRPLEWGSHLKNSFGGHGSICAENPTRRISPRCAILFIGRNRDSLLLRGRLITFLRILWRMMIIFITVGRIRRKRLRSGWMGWRSWIWYDGISEWRILMMG
ncbi:hypothetical protein OCU04_003837 [Sclerotinia nivalis]|uniref:Uncharacterized protein n=1 Tax=Sclerotinia nivalis TaxID=352851 RepID=A0A9X0ASR0_9HELO|nr:hypothetical protein OCU04_003837 [Sclerotinia nivalis]